VVGHVIPLDQEDDTTLVDALGLNPRQAVVIRPDGHVAAVLTEGSGGMSAPVGAALRRATGW
jgi:hypothetical protein